MTDITPAQTATPEPQAGNGQQEIAEPEQSNGTQWTQESAAAEIKALRTEAAKYRKERQAAETARATAEAAALAEQGRYKELYEAALAKAQTADTLQERLDALIAQAQAANERRVAAIPEGMRSLVPDYDDPLKVAAWLDANSAVFQKPQAPPLDGRAGGQPGGPQLNEAAIRAQAVRLGLDPDVYFEQAQRSATKR